MDDCLLLLVLVAFMPAIDNFFVFNETWWKSIRLPTYTQRNIRANKKKEIWINGDDALRKCSNFLYFWIQSILNK